MEAWKRKVLVNAGIWDHHDLVQKELDKKKINGLKKLFEQKFDKLYDWKPKTRFKEKDLRNHRNLPKNFVFNDNLSLTAKSLYPVLCVLADFEVDKQIQVSLENLAEMTGINSQSIKKGAIELQKEGFLKAVKSEGERKVWLYNVWFIRRIDIPDWKGEKFLFHKCIIDSGIWGKLTTRQKVFYLGLRSVAIPDPDLDEEIMDKLMESDYIETYEENFSKRAYDLWIGSRKKLCNQIGMEDVNFRREVIDELENFDLVRSMASDYWSAYEVYFVPEMLKSYN